MKCVKNSLWLFLMPLILPLLPSAAQVQDKARSHWAFQKLAQPAAPLLNDSARVRTPVDVFLLARLQAKGLDFSPDAGREALVRRIYLDLIGLPPDPEEVRAFTRDKSADAVERLLDRLLASPHFGERWGRHWLDNAGYADVTGTDNDAGIIRLSENKWRYRDYVVHAFNDDRPFDRFLQEQIAGDELIEWRSAKHFSNEIAQHLIATGFLRMAADDTQENELNTLDIRYRVLHQTIETVSQNLLGLTMSCAKCHDHKVEPISQPDYYRLQALFQPAFNPERWLQPSQRQIPDIAAAQKEILDKHNASADQSIAELKKQQAKLGKSAQDQKTAGELGQKIAVLQAQRKSWGHWQTIYDVGPPPTTRVLRRGIPDQPRKEVLPGFLNVLTTPKGEQLLERPQPKAPSSGRRLALARWLTDADTPAGSLVLRVRVNRIWQQLFGTGIVSTSDNLGLSGARPSHPELLEWLSCEFRDRGQRLKPFLKLLMTSTVYRQASGQHPGGKEGKVSPHKVDPDNRLLWRMPLRRLESEIIRDSILAVSGKLERTIGGSPTPTEAKPDGTLVISDKGPLGAGPWRRSLYLLARRNYHPTLLGVFDQPNMTLNCTHRTAAPVVLQTLTMLNDAFVLEQARYLAQRVAQQADVAKPDAAIAAFQLVLCRGPRPAELAASIAFLRRQADNFREQKLLPAAASHKAFEQLCHMLLNTSEFVYIP